LSTVEFLSSNSYTYTSPLFSSIALIKSLTLILGSLQTPRLRGHIYKKLPAVLSYKPSSDFIFNLLPFEIPTFIPALGHPDSDCSSEGLCSSLARRSHLRTMLPCSGFLSELRRFRVNNYCGSCSGFTFSFQALILSLTYSCHMPASFTISSIGLIKKIGYRYHLRQQISTSRNFVYPQGPQPCL
jgi:hypothetical protein